MSSMTSAARRSFSARGAATAFAAALLALATACGVAPATPLAPGTDATRTVATIKGEVQVPVRPQRIVVLNHALAGYLFHLDQPVAAVVPEFTDTEGVAAPAWADQAAAAGTVFLPWPADGFNLEAIAAQRPDLIIAGGLGFPFAQAEQVYDQLSAIAPTVLVPKTLQTWQQQLSFLAGDVFAAPQRYDELRAAYDARVAEVAAAITPPSKPSTVISRASSGKVYVLMDDAGLITLLTELGFEPAPLAQRNGAVPYTPGGDMFEVSPENAGVVLDPATIFVVPFDDPKQTVAALAKDPVLGRLPAFRNGSAFDLPQSALRADYDDTMELIDTIEQRFG